MTSLKLRNIQTMFNGLENAHKTTFILDLHVNYDRFNIIYLTVQHWGNF